MSTPDLKSPQPTSPTNPLRETAKQNAVFDLAVLNCNWKQEALQGPFTAEGDVITSNNLEQMEVWEEGPHFYVPSLPVDGRDIAGPLFDAELAGVYLPQLLDSVSGALTADVWDWQSGDIDTGKENIAPVPQASKLEALLTVEKRGCVVWNLFETEQNYYLQLAVVQNFYYKKLVDRQIISEHSANLIFSGIPDLYDLHIKFYQQMEIILTDWDPAETAIGALFLEYVEDLKKYYTKFIDNYAISQKCIKKEEKENSEYVAFMKEAVKMPETSRQSLKVGGRVLTVDLLKSTPPEHPDYQDLESAWQTMADLATTVNDKKRQEEEATGLFDAFEQTKHCPPTLISHRRRMILAVDALCPKTNRSIRLVLCSDLLMLSLTTNKTVLSQFSLGGQQEYNYRFLRWLDLLEIDVVDMHAIKPHTIRITHNTAAISSDRKSNSTPSSEIASVAKDLGATSFVLLFTGYDAAKSRTTFLNAVQTVTKTCKDDILQK
ncbi:Protein T2 [Kappamyces sp. JEL0680]|nr:Protein T2 [Kappamyces sp. JEL0680]